MRKLILLFLVVTNQVFAQSPKEQELKSDIEEVTVFLQGAQITRMAKSNIHQGKSVLKIISLSPHIDGKSVQVKANGEFTLLSVNHKLSYLNKLQRNAKIDSLQTEIISLEFKISSGKSRLEILHEKQSLLNENKNLGGLNSGASMVQLKQAIDFYDKELTSIKAEELQTKLKIQDWAKIKSRIEQEVADVKNNEDLPTGEIEIRIESEKETKGEFVITYLVANAGWFPKYDIRVESIDMPLELKYKADVYQNTGIKWHNVKLRFSNGNPNQSGVVPELQTWYLNFARNTIYSRNAYGVISNSVNNVTGAVVSSEGEPIPGANIVVKGTTIGTISDINGNYALTLPNGAAYLAFSFIGYETKEIPITSSRINVTMNSDIEQLSEVVVTARSINRQPKSMGYAVSLESDVITTSTIENQTTVEFEVDTPYSIDSNGEKLTIDLNRFSIETIFEYYTVPKIDKDAFLIARIVNWDQYNLLAGEANLYFEDAYVGRSVLAAKSLTDTLNISLGRDKNIVVGRNKIDDFTKRRTIGSNKIESRGYKIIARNKKSQAIKLTIFDQIPIPAISDINVSTTELTNGILDEKTGEVKWEINLQPQQQIELKLGYEVKYPKKEKVIIE